MLRRRGGRLAIDTNVVVRYLVGDDPIQAKAARCVVDENEVLVSDTVWLETDGVLRGAYGFSRACPQGAPRFRWLQGVVIDAPIGSSAHRPMPRRAWTSPMGCISVRTDVPRS